MSDTTNGTAPTSGTGDITISKILNESIRDGVLTCSFRELQFRLETLFGISQHTAVEYALADAPRDPWTQRRSTGWTPKTLPEHGRFIVWLYANKMHVGKNRGGLFTADTFEVRADNVEWWRYVDLPPAVARGTEDADVE